MMLARMLVLGIALSASPAAHAEDATRVLRVCADPDNLPFSKADGSGFENRIARVMAEALDARLEFDWLPQIRGWVRKTLGAGRCDAFMGVPVRLERVMATRPYYRSTWVFVQRATANPVTTFDDPRLARMTIGVQLVGDDLAAPPPGHAFAARGLADNVVGFPVVGTTPSAERMIAALAAGRLDLAAVWGPQAGWYASRARPPLHVTPAPPPESLRAVPFEYAIGMGVRPGDTALRDALDGAIERRRADIDAILAAYHVPRTDRSEASP